MTGSAISTAGAAGFSRCRRYRYWLRRSWDTTLPQCAFIGLNPSTADADTDDPTLRRCVDFAKQWGCGSLLLVNLFALRATDPRALTTVPDPIGPRANIWLRRAKHESKLLVAAWGNGGHAPEPRPYRGHVARRFTVPWRHRAKHAATPSLLPKEYATHSIPESRPLSRD